MHKFRVHGFTTDQCAAVFNALDGDRSKVVGIGEFMLYLEGSSKKREISSTKDKDVVEQMEFEINNLFLEFSGGSRVITEQSLGKAMISAGINWDKRKIKEEMIRLDTDQNGTVDKKEFSDFMLEIMMKDLAEQQDSIRDIRNMFVDADINKDGFLTQDELYNMFNKLGAGVSKDDIVTFMSEVDDNKDGKLDINEFIALMQMDTSTMKSEVSEKVVLKMKKVRKLDPMQFARYFKSMPSHFVESAIYREL